MGFYYGPGSPPPEEEDDSIRLRDVVALVFAMFKVLAVPAALMLGGFVVFVGVFWLFTIHLALGYGAIGIGLAGLIWRATWDSKHPKAKKE